MCCRLLSISRVSVSFFHFILLSFYIMKCTRKEKNNRTTLLSKKINWQKLWQFHIVIIAAPPYIREMQSIHANIHDMKSHLYAGMLNEYVSEVHLWHLQMRRREHHTHTHMQTVFYQTETQLYSQTVVSIVRSRSRAFIPTSQQWKMDLGFHSFSFILSSIAYGLYVHSKRLTRFYFF